MEKPIIITSALPYANGPLHIGHMVEYVQTDIYSRFLKLKGKKTVYCCADDTHGTPIEVNAAKQGKTPEQFIAEWFDKHVADMKAYEILHDSYYTTNSKENKHFTESIFSKLKDGNFIYTKPIELTYCDHCKRFLPDRFVKGICPKCGASDQYGDVCEKCNSTYTPVDLMEPHCVICKSTPMRKMSTHYFFKLSAFSDKLEHYLKENKRLQPEIRNQILGWVKEGLEDWCISRDGPYFGFKIPNENDKYFYVWLDAPVGYMASLANYHKGDVHKAEEHWNNAEVVHFIGKDIIYFHLLFWPAVLMASGYHVPDNIVVHGFLNVNKEKMSKSRGTFITAKEFREAADPIFLRYYFASGLTHTMTDLDLDIESFKAKVNNEVVANFANLAYRTLSFINKNYDSQLSEVRDVDLLTEVAKKAKAAGKAYESLDYRDAVKELLEIGTLGNRYFQNNAPWELIKENREETQKVLTDCTNIVKILSIALYPVMPSFCERLHKQLGLKDVSWKEIDTRLENCKIGEAEIVLRKIESVDLKVNAKEEPKAAEEFSRLNLKVAKVLSVSEHYKADKLLLINIDLGTEKRQLVAGLRPYYPDPQVLVGKHIICVTNLEHANLRGEMSQGMLLAAETKDAHTVEALHAPNSKPG
ncbi:MAG: methionine--tRNA ligase, partial [Nanoarchaeota archaeon]|nr:methionine--tRNA ligase [Nanoarchaeota archaeon]